MESKFFAVIRLFDTKVQERFYEAIHFLVFHYKISCDSFLGNRDEA